MYFCQITSYTNLSHIIQDSIWFEAKIPLHNIKHQFTYYWLDTIENIEEFDRIALHQDKYTIHFLNVDTFVILLFDMKWSEVSIWIQSSWNISLCCKITLNNMYLSGVQLNWNMWEIFVFSLLYLEIQSLLMLLLEIDDFNFY